MHIRSYVMTPWQITYWPEPRCSSTALGLPAQSIGVNKGNLDVLCVAFVLFLVSFVALVPVHGEWFSLGPRTCFCSSAIRKGVQKSQIAAPPFRCRGGNERGLQTEASKRLRLESRRASAPGLLQFFRYLPGDWYFCSSLCFKTLKLCLAEPYVIGEQTWGLRKFCEPEEDCTELL